MSSNAFSGIGTGVYFSTEIDGSYTQIAEIPNVDGPNLAATTFDVSDLSSPGGYKEFKKGFKEGSDVTFEMHFTHAGYTAIKAQFDSNDVYFYKLVLPNTESSVVGFGGLVTNLGMKIPMDDKVSAPVTIKVSGAPTFGTTSTTTS